jgi:hypothetical protein
MQNVTLFMIVAVTTLEFFSRGDHWGRFRVLPGMVGYIPELLGMLAALYFIFMGVQTRFKNIRAAYWLIFAAIVLSMLCGIIANHVGPGPTFAGIRNYLRAVPWFLVPAVFAYSDKQIKQQLLLLLAVGFLQIPFAIEQRIKTGVNLMGFVAVTGDWTVGTLVLSPTLTIFLIGSICIAAGYFVRKQIKPIVFLVLFFALLTPTMINETKVTLVILPLGLLITFWCAADARVRGRQIFMAILFLGGFLAVFVPTYNAFMEGREYGVTIGDFFFKKENTERYLSTGKGIGVQGEVGRADSVVIPLKELAKDPVTLAFGYGIGNATESALGHQFTGRYYETFKPFLITGFARMVLEMGLIGLALIIGLHMLIFKDCVAVARYGTGLRRGLAAGWAGVTMIMLVTIPYIDTIIMTSLCYLFWYFSGLIAAERVRLAEEATARAPAKMQREPALRTAYPKTGAYKTNV